MKKIFAFILAGLIAASLLASCDNPNGGDTDETTGDGAESTTTAGGDSTTGAPEQEAEPMHPGIDVLKIDLSQHVALGDYKKSVEYNVYCNDDELADYMIALAKDQDYYTEVKDRVTAAGDSLNVNFAGRVEDVYFQGGTAFGAVVDLTENNGYIEGFADDLYGIMPGTTVETTVTFPENYASEELAGVEAVFEITVNYIYDYTITDEMAKEITSGKYETSEAFAEGYRKSIIQSRLQNYEAALNEEILKMVLENSEIKSYPNELVDYWYDSEMDYYEYYAKLYNMTAEEYISKLGITKDSVIANAKNYAKEDLVLHAIFVKEGLSMSDAEYRVELTRIALENGYQTADELEKTYGEFYMRGMIIKELCFKHLRETLDVKTDKAQYEHLLTEGTEATTGVNE